MYNNFSLYDTCICIRTYVSLTVLTRYSCISLTRDVHEAFLVETEARPRPGIPRPRPRPRRWQFKPRRDQDQGLQSSRPRRGRGVPTPRRDREALLRLDTASRPRRQDRGHIPAMNAKTTRNVLDRSAALGSHFEYLFYFPDIIVLPSGEGR